MSPSREQLSLQGDSLSLTCRAHNLLEVQLQSERSRLFWEHVVESASSGSSYQIMPGEHTNGLAVENFMHTDSQQSSYQSARQQADQGEQTRPSAGPSGSSVLFWSELTIRSLETEHSGLWKCILTTPVGNFTKAVHIRVLGRDLAQCTPFVMRTSRGLFHWQRTLASMATSQPCPLGATVFNSADQQPLLAALDSASATYRCDTHGRWTQLDISACRHVSQIDETIRELLTVSLASLLFYFRIK